MIRLWLLAAALIGAILVFAPRSEAAHSMEHNLQIADAWAAEFPQHPNYCSGGRMNVEFVEGIYHDYDGSGPQPPQRMNVWGAAYGWDWNGSAWFWNPALCQAKVVAGLHPVDTCRVIAHEVMHFVIGPEHHGPLDPAHPGAVGCDPQPAAEPMPPPVRRSTRPRSACQRKYQGRAYRRCLNRRAARRAALNLKGASRNTTR